MSWVIFFVVLFILWSIAVLVLAGPSLRRYDKPVGEYFDAHPDDLAANRRFLKTIERARNKAMATKSLKGGLTIIREFADNLSEGLDTQARFLDVKTTDAAAHPIDAEWTIAPGADSKRRVLFFHGGAFFIGSAAGHRKFTDRLSRVCDAAVLSVNYRMLPEHPRKTGIADAQRAYQWVIENGPEGSGPCDFLLVAGDSAGGNLALMLSSWSRHHSHRRPDAVIGFSPTLDSTAESPTIKLNRQSDKILGPNVGKLCRLPRVVFLWISLIMLRIKPANPIISPIFYNLAALPPTLIHASDSEMLLGDAIRYTNKAIAAGSDVTLQVWQDQLHDWHLFNMGVGSAEQAWSEVKKFVDRLDTQH